MSRPLVSGDADSSIMTTAPPIPSANRSVHGVYAHEVWAWNFQTEFCRLLEAVSAAEEGSAVVAEANAGGESARDCCLGGSDCASGAVIAFDTEFPGCARDMPRYASLESQHKSLRDSVDVLQPIQLGLAVAVNRVLRGVWNFNMRFDLATDLHTEAAVSFLSEAGIDFSKHASEGIDAVMFGHELANSPLVGRRGNDGGDGDGNRGGCGSGSAGTIVSRATLPLWVTFAGLYDRGYLLKLLTDEHLPRELCAFDALLAELCPWHCELRNYLPFGSLQSLLEKHSVERRGVAHTAGSDALATLELFFRTAPGFLPSHMESFSCEEPSSAVPSRTTSTVEPLAVRVVSRQNELGTASTSYCRTERAAPALFWGMSARACMVGANIKASAASCHGHGGTRCQPRSLRVAAAVRPPARRRRGGTCSHPACGSAPAASTRASAARLGVRAAAAAVAAAEHVACGSCASGAGRPHADSCGGRVPKGAIERCVGAVAKGKTVKAASEASLAWQAASRTLVALQDRSIGGLRRRGLLEPSAVASASQLERGVPAQYRRLLSAHV